MDVKLPLRMLVSIARRRMQSHRIRKWSIEDLIVRGGNGLQDTREVRSLRLSKTPASCCHVPSRQNHHFKRPHRPERDHRDKARVSRHNALPERLFHLHDIRTTRPRRSSCKIISLAAKFGNRFIRNRFDSPRFVHADAGCWPPSSPRGSQISAHSGCRPRAQLNTLLRPHIHHRANLRNRHLRQGQVMPR